MHMTEVNGHMLDKMVKYDINRKKNRGQEMLCQMNSLMLDSGDKWIHVIHADLEVSVTRKQTKYKGRSDMTMSVMTRLMMVGVKEYKVGQQLLGGLGGRGVWYQMPWYRPADYWALLQIFQI